ncbi:MAG TPA: DUF4157 domain-containing protein [Nitrospira sp.]|nr:DUF4157 domain-containing protein [Nitrospira sp.]
MSAQHKIPTIQRKCDCGGSCASCAGKEEEQKIQTKLAIGPANDVYEQEADRVADQIMRMPDVSAKTGPGQYSAGINIQRRAVSGGNTLNSVPDVELTQSGGQPLSPATRAFMEPRLGADFSQVRVHADPAAQASAAQIQARAFTYGHHIWLAKGESDQDKHLMAHELTHVVQQRGISDIQPLNSNERSIHGSMLQTGVANHTVQRWPGDGMVPPGDCSWATYLTLRGSVETAKAVVNTLGACSAGDSCLFLATKIAAITAEIAARVALDATCFRGGDEGHRQQVQDKINMMNRCYRFFSTSGCPQELIEAMAVVVEAARAVIAAAAVAVAIALVAALIAAIIALAKVIAALVAAAAAAAAEAAAIAAAAAAVIALLVVIEDELSPDSSSEA